MMAVSVSKRERLDRFELIAELASGGMGSVYLARLCGVGGFQRLYAIKRLHPHLARNRDFISMFLDEARLAARIHHPNVVPILEIGQAPSGQYLVMEYIEGDTAAHLFGIARQDEKSVPLRVSIRIALDALAGLHAAHEQLDENGAPLELVHRDVSPHNILLGVDGIARITDFGVARASTRLSNTRAGQLKGKLAYMAPEQARGATVDRRADVFALGICFWEMLTGKRLFKAEQEAETLNRVLFEPIPTVRSAAPEVPVALEAVCMQALERDPAARFPTAAAFSDAIERAARPLRLIGSARDVSASLEAVLGSDLTFHREAVRAWLVKSEPRGDEHLPISSEGERSSVPSPRARLAADMVTTAPSGPGTSAAFASEESASGGHGEPAAAPSSPSSLSASKVASRPLVLRSRSALAGMAVLVLALAFGGLALRHRARAEAERLARSAVTTSTLSSAAGPPSPSDLRLPPRYSNADALPEAERDALATSSRPGRGNRHLAANHPAPALPPEPLPPEAPPAAPVPRDLMINPYR